MTKSTCIRNETNTISLTKSQLKKKTQECKEITKNVVWQFCDNDLTKCNGSSKKKNENTMKHKSTKMATITLRC